jgi:hypothetical protein
MDRATKWTGSFNGLHGVLAAALLKWETIIFPSTNSNGHLGHPQMRYIISSPPPKSTIIEWGAEPRVLVVGARKGLLAEDDVKGIETGFGWTRD